MFFNIIILKYLPQLDNLMYSKIKDYKKKYEKNIDESNKIGLDESLRVKGNQKAEYDSWGFIYNEISIIRQEVQRLSYYVRTNNVTSPQFLYEYHAHLFDYFLALTRVMKDEWWIEIDKRWNALHEEIKIYFKQRKVFNTKMIPFELIRNLDKLFRLALLIEQKQGMGIRLQRGDSEEIDAAIERAITGTSSSKKNGAN